MEGPQPPQAEGYTQKDLPRTGQAAQTLSCKEILNLEVPLGPEGRDRCCECKCAQMDGLFDQVMMLQKEFTSQCSIQDSEQGIGT